MPRIVTTSWFTKLPEGYLRIGISRGQPRGLQAGYRMYRKLAPGSWFKSTSPAAYKQLYDEMLAALDPEEVVSDLDQLGDGDIPALACFEGQNADPGNWCHRGMVSIWLKDRLGLDVPELGLEDHGCGWSHPKLPEQFRR